MKFLNWFTRNKESVKYPKMKIDIWEKCLTDACIVLCVAFAILSAFLIVLGVPGGVTLEDVHTLIYGRYILAIIHTDYIVLLFLIISVVAVAIVRMVQKNLRKEWLDAQSISNLTWFTEKASAQQRQEFETELLNLCKSCSKGETEALVKWLLAKEEEGIVTLPKVAKKLHAELVGKYHLSISYASFNEHMPSRKK